MTTRVLLVDDHAIVRQGLRGLLELDGSFAVVGEAADGAAAIALARELQPQLVVMDLLMAGVDGVAAIRAIRSGSPHSHIAVLTSSEEDELSFAAIEAGAQSFLLKSMLGDELLTTLRRVAAGESVIHAGVARRILQLVRQARTPRQDPFAELTERELQVLRELAEGGSNARIASALHISEKTVKSHIGSLLAKLQLGDRTEAVAFAWREGLVKRD
jgi:DNA-binding NarL/FixJ family response regulator